MIFYVLTSILLRKIKNIYKADESSILFVGNKKIKRGLEKNKFSNTFL